jgi:glutamate receptor, ionotropic, invertebrate
MNFIIKGGFCLPKRLSIRLIASVWCAAAFVLVNSYYSTLISHVSASYRQPLIEDVNDIPTRPNVKIAINRGLAIDAVLSVS